VSRSYAKISTSLWRSKKLRSLKNNDRAKLLYLYLHTCPHVNSVGCFNLPAGYVTADMGWGEEHIAEALESLQESGLIEWDANEEIVRIVNFIRFDPPTNPKHAGAMGKDALGLPDCLAKLHVLQELLEQRHVADDGRLPSELDRLSKVYAKGIRPIPVPSPVPVRVPDQHPSDANSAPQAGAASKPKSRTRVLKPEHPNFREFYETYPRRESPDDAARAYEFAVIRGATPDELLIGARRYAAHVASDPDGRKFVKLPATWLNKGCWRDEYDALASNQVASLADLQAARERLKRTGAPTHKLDRMIEEKQAQATA
jgi:hypothetical protein